MVMGIATSDEIEKWSAWMEESEQNRAKAKSATAEIAGFEFDAPEIPDLGLKWAELYARTAGIEKNHSQIKHKKEAKLKWVFRVAAILLVMSMAGLGVFYLYDTDESVTHLEQLFEEKTITTTGDEQKTLKFSNG